MTINNSSNVLIENLSDSEKTKQIDKRIIQFVEYLKKERRIPSSEVSESIGVNPSYFSTIKKRLESSYEDIPRHPSGLVIQRLCLKYAASPEWILFGTGAMVASRNHQTAVDDNKDDKELIAVAEKSLSNLKAQGDQLEVSSLPRDLKLRLLELLLRSDSDSR